jgi:flagellar basal-body rod protein FlgF
MDNPTTIALSRLVAQSRALDVTAGNLANAGTPGFRAERVLFSDWLAREPARAEPPGGQTLAFTQDRATYRDRQPGTLQHTGNPLDLAIGGATGWFTVLPPQGPRLTRAGHFQLDATGRIVDEQGEPLLDVSGQPLQTTPTDTRLSVASDGTLSSENGQIGKIGVVQPADERRMTAEGGRLLASASPTAPVASPKLVQGAVEDSNVQPIVELNRMMNDLREFQFTTQFIQGESDRQSGAIEKILKKGTT